MAAPGWITFDAESAVGLDLLGLRAPVQAIGNDLMDGLTSVTPRIRYLSLLCWIVWRYNEAKLPNNASHFRKYAAAQEAAVVIANVHRNGSGSNLVGIEKARKLLNSKSQTLPLEPLVQNIAFNIYASASQQLGLSEDSETGIHILSEQRGLKLAQAFEIAIGKSRYGKTLAKRGTADRINRKDIEQLSQSVFRRLIREETGNELHQNREKITG